MFIAAAITSVLLALLVGFSGVGKIRRDEKVVSGLVKVGVKENQLNQLAGLEIAGAIGLLIGLLWAPIGIAAAAGIVLYFVGALVAHLRVSDSPVVPAVISLFALVTLLLRVVTA